MDAHGRRDFDFVVTMDNRLVLGDKHHFLGNRSDVLAAGQLKLVKGRLARIDNLSGHYQPTVAEAEGFADALRRAGVSPKGATQEFHEITPDANGLVAKVKRVRTCQL